MPSKGRANPCDNPMKTNHKKKSQYKDVYPITEQMLSVFKETLPEFNWKIGTKLCGNCRGKAMYKVKLRHDSLHVAETTGDMQPIAHSSVAARDQTPSPSVAQGRSETGQSVRMGVQIGADEVTSSAASTLPSAPLWPHVSGEDDDMEGSGPNAAPLNSGIRTPLASPAAVSPDTPGSSSEFVTPTRPPLQTRPPRLPLPPSEQSTPTALSDFPSPSVVASALSTESGSVFHDEETAKAELKNLLQQLGVQGTENMPKSKPRKLFKLMSDGMVAFRKRFERYFGGALPADPAPNDCEHCKLLVAAAKAKLPEIKERKAIYLILTTLPIWVTIKQMIEDLGVTSYVARVVSQLRSSEGPYSWPNWMPAGRSLSEKVKQLVLDFYLSNDNSRVSTTARECVYMKNEEGKREKVAKRSMMANLKDSFLEFKKEHPNAEIGISKFAELRPKNVKWPGQKGLHISCTCVIYENFKLMLNGLKNASIDSLEGEFENDPTAAAKLQLFGDYKEFIYYFICAPPTEECYLGYCEKCPNEIQQEEIFKYSSGCNVTYNFWKKNDISTLIEEHAIFEENFRQIFAKFLVHEFIYQQQKEFIKNLKSGSMEDGTSCVLTVDFGENYSFVVQNSVQAFHWNNRQATVHPFCLYASTEVAGKSQYKTFFVISDDLCHDATAFHCFRTQVIKLIKEQFPRIRKIDYVSDGAGSQYKNRKNIANLLHHEDDYNLTARWSYTATCHGKSTCDALSAVVKGTVRVKSLYSSNPITTPERMFKVASSDLSSPTLEFIYVTHEDVEHYREVLASRYVKVKTIPGTQQWHYIEALPDKRLRTKRYGNSENYQELDVLDTADSVETDEMEVESEDQIYPSIPKDYEAPAPDGLPRIGDFYVLSFKNTYQIGRAVEHLFEGKVTRYMMMKKSGGGGRALNWPPEEKIQEFEAGKIVMKIDPPYFYDKKNNYRMSDADFAAVRSVYPPPSALPTE